MVFLFFGMKMETWNKQETIKTDNYLVHGLTGMKLVLKI